MVMAWRFGAVDADAVLAVVRDGRRFGEWMIAVPRELRVDARWPAVGSVVRKESGRTAHGKHACDRQPRVAVVELWQPPGELVVRLRSGLGGWMRIRVDVQARPGGCIVEVRAAPLTPSARLRYAGIGRFQAEERCALVVESLIQLAAQTHPAHRGRRH